ncbi:hypothetical protein [Paraburkholderia sp.]|uniref:hypothetical protein n=1 Tax=Paraburkholderia sp. TaxID=1926495 RepID=UPI0023A34C25|nr:hypothetical protein [Paraburkholderia sp.]MDE1180202.1 hypothetical protein [Paraburkholderia sp.]
MGFIDSLFRRKPSPDAFAALFIAAAKRDGFVEPLHYNRAEFRLEHSHNAVFNLHHAYRAYCENQRNERDLALRGFVATLSACRVTAPDSLADARAMLRPLVRARTVIEDVRLHQWRTSGRDAAFDPAWRAFGDDCAVLLALDYPESTSTLVSGPLASWQLTLEQALAIACDNLRDITADAFVEVARGVFRGDWHDGYDASRVLLPDLLHRAPVHGRPVFMIPTRDTLLVTGDKHDDGLASMIELSLQASLTGRHVSPLMYCYDDGLRRFTPPHDDVAQRVGHLERRYRKDEYDAQKAALDRLHQQERRDLFVANYLLYDKAVESGAADARAGSVSVATWTAGVETLLPKTDRVVLARLDTQQTRIVPWDRLMQTSADLLDDTSMYPVRYRTRGFPDDTLFDSFAPFESIEGD